MTLAMIFDIVVSLLLVVAIFYCWKLSRFLKIIRDSRSDLAQTIYEFNDATNKAQKSIIDLKNASNIIADKLQVKIEKAEFIADDLAYLIERANKTKHIMKDGGNPNQQEHKPAPQYEKKSGSDINPSRRPGRKSASGVEKIARRQDEKTQNADKPSSNEAEEKSRSKAEEDLMNALKSIR